MMQNSLAQLNLYLAFYMINIVIGICYTRYDDTIQIKIYQQTITANYYDQTITVVDWCKKKRKKKWKNVSEAPSWMDAPNQRWQKNIF